MFFPPILITIAGIKSKHSLDRFKKCFLTSCPSEHALPVPLRQKQATIFFPNRINRNAPSTATRTVKMDL